MISQILQANLASWIAQVSVIALLGAFLPKIFRIRHPKTQLAYCHFVLTASLLLPLIQPWHHESVAPNSSSSGVSMTMGAGIIHSGTPVDNPWIRTALWILAAGFIIRLGWLGAGLLHVRRYRMLSMPLRILPDSVRLAVERVGANAVFYVSSKVKSPATIGYFQPVVLLPESFLSLTSPSQHGIACHELLHVRRGDWLVTVVEEIVASVFWFHPGVWWLLAQARLAREQLVDAEVVRLTSAREDYIATLLAIAETGLELDLAPAPLFLRRRHLAQRMRLLLTEVPMSKLRLVTSYTSMAAILTIAAWTMFLSFPLVGQAQVEVPVLRVAQTVKTPPATAALVAAIPAPAPTRSAIPASPQEAPPPAAQTNPLRVGGEVAARNVITQVDPAYPPLARQAGVEGAVIVSIVISKDGTIKEAKIVTSSNPLLLPGVIDAVRQWVYKPTLLNGEPVEVITTVTVNFSLR